MSKSWHVWTIVQQRYKKVEEFLTDYAGIDEYLYPTVEREYPTKNGKKVKDVPLYSNYIFIKYNDDPRTSLTLEKCPWIKTYVGPCSTKEIAEVRKLSKRKYEDLVPASDLREGNSYKLIGTPFTGMRCTVVKIKDDDKVVVAVRIFGADRLITCSIDDIETER
jgi:transcription antitermination factor NusG